MKLKSMAGWRLIIVGLMSMGLDWLFVEYLGATDSSPLQGLGVLAVIAGAILIVLGTMSDSS